MKHVNGVITFLFFLEEFFLWQPGRISTLFEKLLVVLFRTSENYNEVYAIAHYLNPGLSFFLLIISVGPTIGFLKTLFNERAKSDILIWLERHNYVRVILAAFLGFGLLMQLLNIVNDSYLTAISIYQNKTFWTVIFAYIILKRFLSTDIWSQEKQA